ncbi:MAG: GFA family protein [Rhodobacteraceae bacterium]|nr:GFA family protein [Paracoccaceae bacterium]
MAMNPIRGGCLCGCVKFEVKPEFFAFKYCFCSRCRKRSGTVHAANLFTREENFRWIAGQDNVAQYTEPETGKIRNSFCGTCGSRLPRVTPRGAVIPAGSLDDDPGMQPQHCIYWDSRATWLPLPTDLPKLPEAAPAP